MNAYLDEGLRCLRARDWVEAIRSLSWAHDAEPGSVETYLALIDAYEHCAEAEREPDLLQQAFNVCRDLRDRRLPMNPRQQSLFLDAFVRIRDKVVAARHDGWTPPPAKEEMRALLQETRRR